MTNEITSYENNGITFYVSKDGEECGISKTGLAKLAGVTHQELGRLVKLISSCSPDSVNKIPERLIPCSEMTVTRSQTTSHFIDIIPSKYCATILKYYAFDLKNEIALYSCEKFMDIGIDSWIKEVVGFSNSDRSQALLESINATMGKLMVKLERLEEIEEETLGYRKATVSLPLLEKWMNELTEADKEKVLAPADDLFTIKEAVAKEFPNTTFSSTTMKKLALKVGQTITVLSDSPHQKKKTKNGKGFDMKVNAYTLAQLPLIRLCLLSIMAEM